MPKRFVADTDGKRIATARRLLGVYEGVDILVPEIAKRMGVTNNTVYAWERAASFPGDDATLAKLAKLLRVSDVWITHGQELAGAAPVDYYGRTVADVLGLGARKSRAEGE